MAEKNGIKKPIRKKGRATLQEEFYSDLEDKDMYYGAIIRSTAPFGMFTAFSHPDLPDEYQIYRAGDFPGTSYIDTPQGQIPILSAGHIAYPGEPIGIIVGPDENKLQELTSSMSVVYADRNADIDADAGKQDDGQFPEAEQAEAVLDDVLARAPLERTVERGPCMQPNEAGSSDGIDSVFATAPHVVERCWSYRQSLPDYRETNGALCVYTDGVLTVYTPTQWIGNLRQALSQALDLEPGNIVIKRTRSYNRSANSVWYNAIIVCQAAVAAIKCGHPVKLVYNRAEQEQYVDAMLPVTILHKTAADAEGRLLAMKVDIDYDAGAYSPCAQEILDRLVIAACGCYNPLNVCITAKAYRTANPPSSVNMQIIDSAAFFAVENQMNELCKDFGEDLTPLDIRRINFASSDAPPRALPFTFNFRRLTETLDLLNAPQEFNRKYMAYHIDALERRHDHRDLIRVPDAPYPIRGVGMAYAFWGAGCMGPDVRASAGQTLEVTYEEDGSITIHSLPVSKAVYDIWSKQVAAILAINTSAVKINSEFEADKEPVLPEGLYANISIMTDLLKKCCEAIKRKRGNTEPPFSVCKTFAVQRKTWSRELFEGEPFHSTSLAAAYVEVEFDPCTFRESVREVKIVINGGKIFNQRAAESAVRLAVQKIFSTFIENDPLMAEDVRILFVESEDDSVEVGSLVYQVLPAAYTQALSQALDCTVPYLPLQTDSLYKLLREKERKIRWMQREDDAAEPKEEAYREPQADIQLDVQEEYEARQQEAAEAPQEGGNAPNSPDATEGENA